MGKLLDWIYEKKGEIKMDFEEFLKKNKVCKDSKQFYKDNIVEEDWDMVIEPDICNYKSLKDKYDKLNDFLKMPDVEGEIGVLTSEDAELVGFRIIGLKVNGFSVFAESFCSRCYRYCEEEDAWISIHKS